MQSRNPARTGHSEQHCPQGFGPSPGSKRDKRSGRMHHRLNGRRLSHARNRSATGQSIGEWLLRRQGRTAKHCPRRGTAQKAPRSTEAGPHHPSGFDRLIQSGLATCRTQLFLPHWSSDRFCRSVRWPTGLDIERGVGLSAGSCPNGSSTALSWIIATFIAIVLTRRLDRLGRVSVAAIVPLSYGGPLPHQSWEALSGSGHRRPSTGLSVQLR